MKYDFENINLIADAIREPATASSYDWHMFFLGSVGILVSGIIAGAAAYFAYQLNKKQITIAERQSKISEEQTEIAKKQSEIMEQQNKIALFDKRYEIYIIFFQFAENIGFISENETLLVFINKNLNIAKYCHLLNKINGFESSGRQVPNYNKINAIQKVQPAIKELFAKLDTMRFIFELTTSEKSEILEMKKNILSFDEHFINDNIKLFEEKLNIIIAQFKETSLVEKLKSQLVIS